MKAERRLAQAHASFFLKFKDEKRLAQAHAPFFLKFKDERRLSQAHASFFFKFEDFCKSSLNFDFQPIRHAKNFYFYKNIHSPCP